MLYSLSFRAECKRQAIRLAGVRQKLHEESPKAVYDNG